jgi:DNA replication factor GINS
MYDEIYSVWLQETGNRELTRLQFDFYERVGNYFQSIKEESRMIDGKNVRMTLLKHEMLNARRMAKDIISIRYRKILKRIASGRESPSDFLTSEEKKLQNGVMPLAQAYNKYAVDILEGHLAIKEIDRTKLVMETPLVHKRLTLRFTKAVPSIIGVDMKSYGPFQVEDVASVPLENAKVLIRQGLAKAIEID